jgi:hypothetical protein
VEGELAGATAVARGRFGDEGTGGEVKALQGGKAAAGTGTGGEGSGQGRCSEKAGSAGRGKGGVLGCCDGGNRFRQPWGRRLNYWVGYATRQCMSGTAHYCEVVSGDGGIPIGGKTGDFLSKGEFGSEWVGREEL